MEQTLQGNDGSTSHIGRMLQTHPAPSMPAPSGLQDCIAAVFDCAQACVSCADACLAEREVAMLTRCIRLDMDCADICDVTGRLLSRQTAFEPRLARAQLEACVVACQMCAQECQKHGQRMEHCRVCADACLRCEQACRQLLTNASA